MENPDSGNWSKQTSLNELLKGEGLARLLKNNSTFLILFMALTIVYIANGYSLEKLQREREELETEVKDLRFESISAAAELMFIQKQSEVMKQIEKEGMTLQESKVPPMKLYR